MIYREATSEATSCRREAAGAQGRPSQLRQSGRHSRHVKKKETRRATQGHQNEPDHERDRPNEHWSQRDPHEERGKSGGRDPRRRRDGETRPPRSGGDRPGTRPGEEGTS
ncbi:hypothetical protein EUGRSUZ_C04411 [Eucalyptus grandis]|uniref:Uncharacterized protein n=2 Tax=Eucalyptus grandis TaxID=71139 RepID=A0ACC3LLI3_EUCGR|nr:hypothetical protein EUGRSUZ_C04411 [Eucalyptus grandis]